MFSNRASLAECGTHGELVARGGLYARLYRHDLAEDTGNEAARATAARRMTAATSVRRSSCSPIASRLRRWHPSPVSSCARGARTGKEDTLACRAASAAQATSGRRRARLDSRRQHWRMHFGAAADRRAARSILDRSDAGDKRHGDFGEAHARSACLSARCINTCPIDAPVGSRKIPRSLEARTPRCSSIPNSGPTCCCRLAARRARLALINGRMSARAFAGWRRAPRTARARARLQFRDLSGPGRSKRRRGLRSLGARRRARVRQSQGRCPPEPADPAKLAALAACHRRPAGSACRQHPSRRGRNNPARA